MKRQIDALIDNWLISHIYATSTTVILCAPSMSGFGMGRLQIGSCMESNDTCFRSISDRSVQKDGAFPLSFNYMSPRVILDQFFRLNAKGRKPALTTDRD